MSGSPQRPLDLLAQDRPASFKTMKAVVVGAEAAVVVTIGIIWLTSQAVRDSRSLWVLFLYAFPAEFIIAALPHEPVLLYFSKYHTPLAIALVSIAGTALTEVINYTLFRFIADLNILRKLLESNIVKKTVALFQKAPFLAIWVAAFTPVPFYPFRFLVVLTRYPIYLYLLAVITARTPRFFLLAVAGKLLRISDLLLAALFALTIIVLYSPAALRYLKKRWFEPRPRPGGNADGR